VTSQLTLSVPATLTVLAGNAVLSSLDALGPGITVTGAGAADTVSVRITAGNAASLLTASGSAGASIAASGNILNITGTSAEVNAALASLELTEPVGAAADVLSLSANDTAAVGVQSAFAVNVVPHTGPAFVAPAMSVTLQPNALTVLPDLLLSDPIAAGLSAMGLGKDETLSLTLSVAQGVLLLPGLGVLGGIAATGVGTGTIELSFTADEIAALNTLLAGLEFAARCYLW